MINNVCIGAQCEEIEDYLASRVDSWCLGWNTFYLLTSAAWPKLLVSQLD